METSVHHKGVEFEVVEVLRFRWRWTIYAKKSLDLGKTTREIPATSRKQVVAKCRQTRLRAPLREIRSPADARRDCCFPALWRTPNGALRGGR